MNPEGETLQIEWEKVERKTKKLKALADLRVSVGVLRWQRREPICEMAARRLIARQLTHHIGTFIQTRRCRSAQLAFWDRYIVFHSDLQPPKFYLHLTFYPD